MPILFERYRSSEITPKGALLAGCRTAAPEYQFFPIDLLEVFGVLDGLVKCLSQDFFNFIDKFQRRDFFAVGHARGRIINLSAMHNRTSNVVGIPH